MYFLYFGCLNFRSTRMVMDLSIASLETMPSSTRRLLRACSELVSVVVSVIASWPPRTGPWAEEGFVWVVYAGSASLGGRATDARGALGEDGLDARNRAAQVPDSAGVGVGTHRGAETRVAALLSGIL